MEDASCGGTFGFIFLRFGRRDLEKCLTNVVAAPWNSISFSSLSRSLVGRRLDFCFCFSPVHVFFFPFLCTKELKTLACFGRRETKTLRFGIRNGRCLRFGRHNGKNNFVVYNFILLLFSFNNIYTFKDFLDPFKLYNMDPQGRI